MSLWKLLEGVRILISQQQKFVPHIERRNMEIPMTGIPEIDYDHMEIVRLINKVTPEITHEEFIDFSMHVLDYIGRHVRQEEKIMERYNYPGLRLHHLEHQTLRGLISVYIKPDGNPVKDRGDIVRECREIFRHHIQAHDIPFASFVRQQETSNA